MPGTSGIRATVQPVGIIGSMAWSMGKNGGRRSLLELVASMVAVPGMSVNARAIGGADGMPPKGVNV